MKRISFLVFLIFILIVLLNTKGQTNIYDSIKVGILNRTYLLHIPPSYNPASPMPLVIGLHRGGSFSWYGLEQMSQLIFTSNSSGFLLVYPEGIKYMRTRTWNAGGCCGYASAMNINDVSFISAMIDSLKLNYNIDTNRIYATGISNGGLMSYRLACELSHRIAAIAVITGTLEDNTYSCTPSRPVPIIQFHSVLDSNIYMAGGYSQGASGYSFQPVNYGLNKFSNINSCAIPPDSTYHTSGSTFYYKKHWKNCQCATEHILYVTGNGGHSWPGGVTGTYPGADPPSSVIKANNSL